MNIKETLELAHRVIAQTKRHGAQECAVNISKERDIEIGFRDRKMEELKESTQNSLSLSIYSDNRYSNHRTNDIRKSSLDKFAEEAVAMTKYLSEDPYRSLPDARYYEGRTDMDLQIYDSSYESVESSDRVKIARELEDVALAQSDQIVSCSSGYSDYYFQSVKVHSNGFEGYRKGTSFSASLDVSVRDKEGGRPSEYKRVTVRFAKDLPSLENIGKETVRRALSRIGQTKLKSGKYDLVVENRAVIRGLYSLYEPMRARSLQQKSSFLEDKIGQRIASKKLTWIDDPFVVKGLGSRLYDGEGLATRRRVMIDKGILKSYYIDCYYGKKLGIEPTTGSATNVVMDYGSKSLEDLIKEANKGILVTRFIGGNSNSTTGDFSTGIFGTYFEDGELVRPIGEMNVSGNHSEFWNNLVEVGNDPYEYSSWRRPSMYFKDVQLSGI